MRKTRRAQIKQGGSIMNKSKLIIFLIIVTFIVISPFNIFTQTLIYENPVVYVYELPSTESLRGNPERVATSTLGFIVKELSGKGFSEIITAVSSKLVSSFASLFVGLINEAKTVGWPGDVEIFFLAEGNITNTVNANEYFLPIIAVQTGDSLNPLRLKIETPLGSDSTNLIPEEEITNLSWSNINLVIPKRPYRFSNPGKYTFICTVFSTRCSKIDSVKF